MGQDQDLLDLLFARPGASEEELGVTLPVVHGDPPMESIATARFESPSGVLQDSDLLDVIPFPQQQDPVTASQLENLPQGGLRALGLSSLLSVDGGGHQWS